MNPRRCSWKFLAVCALLVFAALAISFWLSSRQQRQRYNRELTRQLLTSARLVRDAIRNRWPDIDPDRVARLTHTLGSEGVRSAILSANGQVLSELAGGDARLLLDAPEVHAALLDGSGSDVRDSTGSPHIMAAVRVGSDEETLGVVWLSRPVWTLAADREALAAGLAVAGGAGVLLTILLWIAMIRMRRRLLSRLISGARGMSAGDLSAPIDVGGADEFAMLSAALGSVRRRLGQQVATIDRQKRMLESLVDQLQEGIVAARRDGRIVLINPAAVRLLQLQPPGATPERFTGQPVEAVVPQNALQRMFALTPDSTPAATGASKTTAEAREQEEIEIETPDGITWLTARAADLVLSDDGERDGGAAGRMVVLSDITGLRRTIQTRTDFVANASHELRTPLSTIRAAIEAVLGMDLPREGEAARRFIEKIDRHSARLERMVADLLDLSRIESADSGFEPEELSLRGVLDELHGRFEAAIEARSLRWEARVEAAGPGSIRANPHLLRLVLDNLVENAIKFTESEGTISVRARRDDGSVRFEVADTGCGIPESEQQRVFERFYQVQRHRSGPERGTGLGLSIVRHALGAMQGTVRLESVPQKGTTVTVTIPQPN
jgi:signal transduction histidine kinase